MGKQPRDSQACDLYSLLLVLTRADLLLCTGEPCCTALITGKFFCVSQSQKEGH